MTPESDIQRQCLLSDMQGMNVSRSQSDTSHEGLASRLVEQRGRRSSEWSTKEDKKVVLRPLQLNEEKHGGGGAGLLHRRLSKPKEALSRSYSVRLAKKNAEGRNRGSSIPNDHCIAKATERTVSNRSLPLPGDESEYLRLRNFSVTSKGVVNRGDSFRCKDTPVLPKEEVREEEGAKGPRKKAYRVVLIGASGVGKSSIWKQFMTSEYICANDFFANDRECEKNITVILNNEESQMEFEVETLQEENVYVSCEELDAYVIVYSVTDRRSYSQARRLLSQLERLVDNKAVILVANKTDLARLRVVTTEEGKSLAKDRGCKFIETSVAINHQLDELLVGTLAQIRIKAKARKSSLYSGCKASGVLKKILRRACIKSKSCDNLHVL